MMKKHINFLLLFLSSFILSHKSDLHAGVIVHDKVALMEESIVLTAETRGRLFPRGGELVEFIVNEESIGSNLSGGDGFIFKEFTPKKPGLLRISAQSDTDTGEGLLLVIRKTDKIVCIDVEGSVLEDLLLFKPREGSIEAIRALSERFPVIYLQTGPLGFKVIRKWLKEQGFQEMPLIPWKEGAFFDEMEEEGIQIKAVIGGPFVIQKAKEFKYKSYSFSEAEGAETVENWGEIEKKLH